MFLALFRGLNLLAYFRTYDVKRSLEVVTQILLFVVNNHCNLSQLKSWVVGEAVKIGQKGGSKKITF